MKRTGWKILFTIICLATAGGLMVGLRNTEASAYENTTVNENTSADENTTVNENTSADENTSVNENTSADEETSVMTQEPEQAEPEGPLIEWEMEDADSCEGISYYRQDNCGLTVTISDTCPELTLAEVMISDAGFSLDDFEHADAHTHVFALTSEELSDLIKEDGEVTVCINVKDAEDRAAEDTFMFVLDRTPPEYTLTFEDPAGYETADGEIAYYGSSHDRLCAVYTITEEYFSPLLIGADKVCADVTGDHVNTDVKIKQIAGGTGYTGEQSYTVRTDDAAEGVYRFGISGTDLAGNPLVMSEAEMQKEGFRKSVQEEDCGYWTEPKVLDLTNPSLFFTVSDQKGTCFYEVTAADQKTTVSVYEPFQQSDRAKIVISVKDGVPCRIKDQIWSSVSGVISGGRGEEPPFLTDPVITETITGQQQFRIDHIAVRDRAGNLTRVGKSNVLFLDLECPKAKISAPAPAAYATEKITHRHADGRGLYRDNVTLQVTVEDAAGKAKGSGLGNVSCRVFVDGAEADAKMTYAEALSDCLNDTPDVSLPAQIVYGDDTVLASCKTEFAGTITIPKGGIFETNDIEILVYATDCAGNGTEEPARFLFGMDSEGPEVRVRFDNNEAENDCYFKKPRNATVEICDRNINADLIVTDTQSPAVSELSYIRGRDSTGSDDCYEKTIRYCDDGAYTLTISGTDALGNAFAKEVRYEGVSPTQFVIDQTAPVILVEKVEEGKAYNGEVRPVIRFSDENFRRDLAELTLFGAREGNRMDLVPALTEETKGGSCVMQNIPVKKQNDDIYTLNAKLRDLAGNECRTEIAFSVNRFGSTYDYNNDRSTQKLMEDYFTCREQKIYLREINLSRLIDQKVTLYHDGSNRVLQRGADYQIREEAYGDAVQYIYAFSGRNFRKEGIYEVIVQSADAAGNINSNHAMRQDEDIESVRIRFAVDKTAPQILLNGIDAAKAPAFPEGEKIQVLPGDNMQLQLVELSLETSETQEKAGLGVWKDGQLLEKLMHQEGMLSFAFDADNKEQKLVIRAVDMAGNISVGTASCIVPEAMQRNGLFVQTPQKEGEETQETASGYGIVVAVAGALLLCLLGRKKRSRT